jgi:TPP-dependent pyruvate/acetoin dehydrogenase alpha subunit
MKNWMLETGAAGEDEIREIDEAAKEEVGHAVQFARSSPAPLPEEARDDLYTLQGAQ